MAGIAQAVPEITDNTFFPDNPNLRIIYPSRKQHDHIATFF
jgi:hypothetical protein